MLQRFHRKEEDLLSIMSARLGKLLKEGGVWGKMVIGKETLVRDQKTVRGSMPPHCPPGLPLKLLP